MKLYSYLAAAALGIAAVPQGSRAEARPSPFVTETPREFFATGDFNGDGQTDYVIVDKETGKYRLGFSGAEGAISWVDCRYTGLKGVAGFSVGKLFAPNRDAFAFASPDGNQLSVLEANDPVAPGKPNIIPFTAGLGPSAIVAIDIGGPGNTPVDDLYVGSIYNSPDENLGTLLRNDGKEYAKIADVGPLAGVPAHANHVALKTGQREVVCLLTGDTLNAESLSSGKAVSVAKAAGLPAGADYAVGHFRGAPLADFVIYKAGQSKFEARPVEEGAAGQFAFGKGASFDLGQPIRRVVALEGARMVVIFGEGDQAAVYSFDGVNAPVSVQTMGATNEVFTCAEPLPNGFILFSQPATGKFSTRYRMFAAAGSSYTAGRYGSLSTLADNDNITIPDIHKRIEARLKVGSESEMKVYTNTIPGTRVAYVMVPIPGGEYVMGSAESEKGRKADEGPLHKVKISPFWMGRCEVTWNEYELFMYPEEEKRMRATEPTDAAGDKLADAVTHPSRPYVEMSFGMGKENCPAISMTQHAANKYCQWLSAKTGEFYRLPTEAEWEYACRAGTTNAYFFGDDAKQLGEYAWFEQNSNFKYQKVGKKKPNPWGLYDMYGNVVEWVLDQYDPGFYKQCADQGVVIDPWLKATKPYPHSVRGGSWDDEAVSCRSAARRGSDRAWKAQDPQLPKSIWYHSDAQWVGFRVVRPLKVPPAEQLQKYWSSGVERD